MKRPCAKTFLLFFSTNKSSVEILQEHIPNGHDVADAACKHKEMKHCVHVSSSPQTVEQGPRDVAHPFGHYPDDGCRAHTVDERFEGHEHRQSHQAEADGFQVAVVFQLDEAADGSGYGACPDEDEEIPAPPAMLAQGYERDG